MTNTINQQILDLHRLGYSIRQIATKLGITKYTVEKTLNNSSQTLSGKLSGQAQTLSEVSSGQAKTVFQPVSGQAQTAHGGTSDAGFTEVGGPQVTDLPSQPGTQEPSGIDESFLRITYKYSLSSSYRDFLYSCHSFLAHNVGSESLALTLIENMQARIDALITRARRICAECDVEYNRLFMAYTLDKVYLYLEQKPEFIKGDYDTRIKVDPSIQFLLKKASKSEVFATREDYKAYFPDINR